MQSETHSTDVARAGLRQGRNPRARPRRIPRGRTSQAAVGPALDTAARLSPLAETPRARTSEGNAGRLLAGAHA